MTNREASRPKVGLFTEALNVPRLGKNHLRGWQSHRLIMIRPNGGRVYAFYPWEKNLQPVPLYVYEDVPIYDYLQELTSRGESIRAHRTIWTCF